MLLDISASIEATKMQIFCAFMVDRELRHDREQYIWSNRQDKISE